jgi:hypothetical protein
MGLARTSLSRLRPAAASRPLVLASITVWGLGPLRRWSSESETSGASSSSRIYLSSGEVDWSRPYPAGYPVGLRPDPEAVERLVAAYKEILTRVQKLASESAYRRNVETVTRHRLEVAEANRSDRQALEAGVGAGLVEELLAAAYDELDLIKHIEQWKPWVGQENRTIPLHVID